MPLFSQPSKTLKAYFFSLSVFNRLLAQSIANALSIVILDVFPAIVFIRLLLNLSNSLSFLPCFCRRGLFLFSFCCCCEIFSLVVVALIVVLLSCCLFLLICCCHFHFHPDYLICLLSLQLYSSNSLDRVRIILFTVILIILFPSLSLCLLLLK